MEVFVAFTVSISIIYIIICAIVVHSRTHKIEGDGLMEFEERVRPTEPIDVWIGLFWPITLVWLIAKAVLYILHEGLSLILFMLFIRYRSTTLYTNIKRSLEL